MTKISMQIENPGGSPGSVLQKQLSLQNNTKRPVKWIRLLTAFAAGRSLNMKEGEQLGDHALPSTVAGLQARGLTILRCEETIAGWAGAPTRVMRYWLAPESFELARELLGHQPLEGQDHASAA